MHCPVTPKVPVGCGQLLLFHISSREIDLTNRSLRPRRSDLCRSVHRKRLERWHVGPTHLCCHVIGQPRKRPAALTAPVGAWNSSDCTVTLPPLVEVYLRVLCPLRYTKVILVYLHYCFYIANNYFVIKNNGFIKITETIIFNLRIKIFDIRTKFFNPKPH